jgi:hypothetical protein
MLAAKAAAKTDKNTIIQTFNFFAISSTRARRTNRRLLLSGFLGHKKDLCFILLYSINHFALFFK